MVTKPVSISFNGNIKKVFILYTFSFNKKKYALASLDRNYTELRVLRIKYSFTNGNSAETVTDEEILRAGEAVFNEIKSSQVSFFNGEHYIVNKDESGDFCVTISGRLFRFNMLFRFVAAVITILFSVEVSGFGWYYYFKYPHDWVKFIAASNGCLVVGLVSFAIICLSIIGAAVYQRAKGKGSGAGFGMALFMPLFMSLCFGLTARTGVRILVIALVSLITGFFFFNIFRIKKMKNNKFKKDSLNKLLRLTKFTASCAFVFAVAFSIVSGYISPYRRNDSMGFIKKALIEKHHIEACEELKVNNWQEKSEAERVKILQKIVDYNALKNGTFSAKIVPVNLNSWLDNGKTYGSYRDELNLIYIDKDYTLENATDSVETVLHEFRHAQQYCVAECKNKDEDELLAKAFKANIDNYKSADIYGADQYYSQICEVDSRFFVSENLDYYLRYIPLNDYESSDYYTRLNEQEYVVKTYKTGEEYDYAVCHPYQNGDDYSKDYIELCRFTGSGEAESVFIPTQIDNLPVTSIGKDLFHYVNNTIQTAVIPSSVSNISDLAFDNCDKLTIQIATDNTHYKLVDNIMFVSLSDNRLQWVDKKATGTITIPKNIDSIGWYAFSGCNISDIDVQDGNSQYFSEKGLLYNNKTKAFVLCPEGREGIVELAKGCTVIRSEAFSNCSKVTEVIIPDSVKEIESEAFTGCSSLLRLTIPSTVKKVSAYAFYGLDNLDRLSISKNSLFFEKEGSKESRIVLTNMNLKDIFFDGTQAEWENVNAVFKGRFGSLFGTERAIAIHCTDGTINKTV